MVTRIKTRLDKLEEAASPGDERVEVVQLGDEAGTVYVRSWRDGVLVDEVIVRGCFFLPEFEDDDI